MGFQNLLARRYIFSQKRHSVLTICSIAAALTLMTVLFTGFSTIWSCLRATEYDRYPYHCLVYSVTEAQGEALAAADGIAGCELVQNPGEDTYQALLFFEKDVRDEDLVLSPAFEQAGMELEDEGAFRNAFQLNKSLMRFDFVGSDAWYEFAHFFALFYVFVMFLAMVLRLVIDTAFEISSKERERQFGVLQSIGATPRQVVGIITLEGILLSVIGIPLGILLGIGLSYGTFELILQSGILDIFYTSEEKASELLQFSVNPWMLLASAVTGFVWVWLSAYGTGMRIIKMSPMEAISSHGNTVRKVRKHRISGRIFGWIGTLAARNTRRAPKRFLITVLSLTLSITLFASFTYITETVESAYVQLTGEFDFVLYHQTDTAHPLDYKEALQELETCGYFENIQMVRTEYGEYPLETDWAVSVFIDHYNQEGYEALFSGDPPISYEALAATGGYVVLEHSALTADPDMWEDIQKVQALDTLQITARKFVRVTEEEYAAASEEEQKKMLEMIRYDAETDETSHIAYYRYEKQPVTLDAKARYTIPDNDFCEKNIISNYAVSLVTTLAQYERTYTSYGDINSGGIISCDLADEEDYRAAMTFIEKHDTLSMYADVYTMNRQIRSTAALVKILVGFLNAIIALIALVNMVNIISTGILNRRSELASMQCVGMTERQLYGMTVVECLQYVLISGAAASVLCVLLMFITMLFLDAMTLLQDFEDKISFTAPLGVVWLAAAAAFAAAFLTSYLSLQGMKKQTLVEQIRSVD